MKLVVVIFSFTIFIIRAASIEFDPTDDKTIDYFLAQFFQGGDPSTFNSIEAEVKKHSGELLSGFLSLVGGSFDFEASDMKAQFKKFQEDFDVEKLKKVVENIFGLGSVVVSQLEKNSATVKDKIIALIESVLIESGSARKKRNSEDRLEFNRDSAYDPIAENESLKKKDQINKEKQQAESNNIKNIKDRKYKASKIIPKENMLNLGFLPDLNNLEDIGEKFPTDIPTPNVEYVLGPLDLGIQNDQLHRLNQIDESNKDQINSVNTDSKIPMDFGEDDHQDISSQTLPSDEDPQDPLNTEVRLLPDLNNLENTGEKFTTDIPTPNVEYVIGPLDLGIQNDQLHIVNQKDESNKDQINSVNTDEKIPKDFGEDDHQDISSQKAPSDEDPQDPLNTEVRLFPDLNNLEDIGEEFITDIPTPNVKYIIGPLDLGIQNDQLHTLNQTDESNKDQINSVNTDEKIPKDFGEDDHQDISSQKASSDEDPQDPLNTKVHEDDEFEIEEDDRKEESDSEVHEFIIPKDFGEDDHRDISSQKLPSDEDPQDPLNTEVHEDDEFEIEEDDRKEESDSEVHEIIKKITNLSQELVEKLVDLSMTRSYVLEDQAKKVSDKIKDTADESRDRAFKIFNMYGKYLYKIFDKEAERIL